MPQEKRRKSDEQATQAHDIGDEIKGRDAVGRDEDHEAGRKQRPKHIGNSTVQAVLQLAPVVPGTGKAGQAHVKTDLEANGKY